MIELHLKEFLDEIDVRAISQKGVKIKYGLFDYWIEKEALEDLISYLIRVLNRIRKLDLKLTRNFEKKEVRKR